jgi:dipeptidyl aminopeptidase/acylaminoacyl peptidase
MARTAWHPFENNRLAICGDEKFVEIWDVRAAKAAMKLPTQGNNLNVSWSRDGIYLAVGNRNEYFLIFDTRTGALVRKKKFTHEMNEMAWSFQSDYLLVASGVDGMGALNVVSVFNENSPAANSSNSTDELTVFDTLIAHSGACQQLAVDPTCRRIAIGGTDRVVSLWSLEDLVCENFVPLDVSTEIRGLSFSPDGQYLAIATGLANSNQASSSQGDEQGVLIVHADSAEPIARVDVRMKCSSIAWQPVVNTSRGELSQQQVHVGNAVNPLSGGNHAPSGEGTHQSHHILAVVCDDKNATLSATTGGGAIGSSSSSSSILTSGSNSNPVFLRLIVFPCTP